MKRISQLAGLAVFWFVAANGPLIAGPPLICHPIQIGNAKSLPGGSGPFGTLIDYDRTGLVEETLELLKPDMPILVRMETLRRATLYASGIYRNKERWTRQSEEDRRLAFELLARLMSRALQPDLSKETSTLATFDVGYLMACYTQTNLTKDFQGYDLVKKALAQDSQNAEMEFACALVTVWPKNSEHGQHLQKARSLARNNSLLSANLALHFGNEKVQ